MEDDESKPATLLTHEELVTRAEEIAHAAVNQCDESMSGPFIILSSMTVLLSAAANLCSIGKVEPKAAIRIFEELLEAHYETARKEAN